MRILTIIIGLVWLTTSATALILNVPDEYSTIQSAITASSSGDTVLVQPGTYQQNITFQGRAVTVASTYIFTGEESAIEQTIINGGNSNSCVRFNNDETASSKLIGFTLTNGSTDYYGGGIYCYGASPTLSNLIITGNSSEGGGGMAFFSHSSATGSDILVEDNSGDEGGGIYCHDFGDIIMTDLVVRNNSSNHGGGILISYSDPIFSNTVIYDNNAPFGGGVYVYNYSTPQFYNATVTGNSADYGGGFYCSDLQCQPNIYSSILWQNTPQEVFALSTYYPPVITYTDVEDGTWESWFGEGCIDDDPLFANPNNNDFHLTVGSPCIDTGDPDAPPDPDGTVVDMGAYPFTQNEEATVQITDVTEFTLAGNYPNPFNLETVFHYTLRHNAPVELVIFTVAGQRLATPVNQFQPAGRHQVNWRGVDYQGKALASGIYLYRLTAGEYQATGKITLVK